jgi:MFS family permease
MASEPSSLEGRRDRLVLASTRTARGFGAGALSIVLALQLASAGYSPFLVGGLLGLAMAGASAWSLLIPRFERRVGRRRVFLFNAVALSVGGFLLWLDLASIWVVGVALLLGGIVAGTADISPLGALEQATLADATPDRRRTVSFSQYNLVGYVGNAFGALAAGPLTGAPLPLPGGFPVSPRDLALLLYALLGVALIPAYSTLSKGVLLAQPPARRGPLSSRSRSIILSLSGLFSVDAFGGGLIVNSLVTYYLAVRFHPSIAALGVVFFAGNLAAALSLVAAVPLARRFGLINTMVFTHLPSSALLIAFAFAPTFLLSAVVWVGRSSLSQMDVPTRQSYTQAVIPTEDRATAAGYTTAARSAQMFGGPVTGAFLEAGGPWLAGPFILAGSVKIVYDVAVYSRFRRLRPPEETAPRTPHHTAD